MVWELWVLNLIITGIPSIPYCIPPEFTTLSVLNLIITGIPSILGGIAQEVVQGLEF